MNQNLIKVAAAQIDGAYGDIGANLSRHLGLIAQARASAVGLLVFPELSLCGHGAGKDALRRAMPRDDPVIAALAEASTDLHTVFGFIEEAPAGQFYNSQATVAHGKLIHVHRKVQLATYGKLRDGCTTLPARCAGVFRSMRAGRWPRPSARICGTRRWCTRSPAMAPPCSQRRSVPPGKGWEPASTIPPPGTSTCAFTRSPMA